MLPGFPAFYALGTNSNGGSLLRAGGRSPVVSHTGGFPQLLLLGNMAFSLMSDDLILCNLHRGIYPTPVHRQSS